MTDMKIKALIAQVEQMIAEQEKILATAAGVKDWSRVADLDSKIIGMRQVLAVIRLYEE